jgi:site-specific recombinase XerD
VERSILRERKLYYVCNKIGKSAGVKGKISLHKYRHTFASQLVQNNVRIELIQKLLEHSSIKETMIYAHLKSDSLHDEVKILDRLFGNITI